MARRTPKATDSVPLSQPNTTGVHIQRPKPEKIRTGGLHSIAATGKAYTCPELRRNPHRAGSADASRRPSLSSFSQPSKP